jgi:uncharacterized zinc-type alcohol dehydrogenase-like protein
MPTPVKAYAAQTATTPLAPFDIERRDIEPTDVAIEILHCGVCHSDVHQTRDEWSITKYPCVPGHEIIGRVTNVGEKVTKLQEGDLAAVGCIVGSCGTCAACTRGLEQYCAAKPVFTYNGVDTTRSEGHTFGGYSQAVVVDEGFTLRVAADVDPAASAPLVCAGITTWSPLRHWEAGPGKKVGIVGLGGLGHMGVKFARSFGAHVVLFTTSPAKIEDGLRLGAHEVVVSSDAAAMAKHAWSFDLIVDCVSADHDVSALMNLLALDGTLAFVGAPAQPLSVGAFDLLDGRRRLAGSGIGSIAETQEMLDYCAVHGITSDIEPIAIEQINEAYERMLRGDVRYRFVIDLASLR